MMMFVLLQFISSSVPHREILQSAVKPGVIAIPYVSATPVSSGVKSDNVQL